MSPEQRDRVLRIAAELDRGADLAEDARFHVRGARGNAPTPEGAKKAIVRAREDAAFLREIVQEDLVNSSHARDLT
jgi:hypothetical protein